MAAEKRPRLKPPQVCPVCQEDVPHGALACPECGADHNSGWKEDAAADDGLDLPGEDFDYDQFVRAEFGASPKPAGISTMWWITALLILAAMAALYLFGR